MKFCANCGNGNDEGSKFCRKCGTAFGGSASASGKSQPDTPIDIKPSISAAPEQVVTSEPGSTGTSTTSLPLNIAHFLCYIAGWITGIIFLVIEKKERSTRFHAWQSIITFGPLTVLSWIFNLMPAVGLYSIGWFFSWVLWAVIYIGGLALWIILIVKSLQGQDYHLPVIGDIAHKLAYGKPAGDQAKQDGKVERDSPDAAGFDLPPAPHSGKADNKVQTTKFCIACGESLPGKAVFCSRCGEKQP